VWTQVGFGKSLEGKALVKNDEEGTGEIRKEKEFETGKSVQFLVRIYIILFRFGVTPQLIRPSMVT
jgi:hypothetical protein